MQDQPSKNPYSHSSHKLLRASWWDQLVSLIIVVNVLLVFFDLSYLSLRHIYLHYSSGIVALYDPIADHGFWQIDRYFIGFFALEFVRTTFFLSRKRQDLTWRDAMLRRWYDAILLLPFWRWLRVIPALVRIHRSGLVNLERLLAQITHEPTAYLADRVSMFLLVRYMNQAQDSIKRGEVTRQLLQSDYIQVGDSKTLDTLIARLFSLTIDRVLPQVQPNLKVLLRQSLKTTLQNSDVYQGLHQIPGIEALPIEVTDQLADYLAESTATVLETSYTDPQNRYLLEQLTKDFKQSLRQALQDQAMQQELQMLVSDLLEELKINYIQRSADRDPEVTLHEVNQIQEEAVATTEPLDPSDTQA